MSIQQKNPSSVLKQISKTNPEKWILSRILSFQSSSKNKQKKKLVSRILF